MSGENKTVYTSEYCLQQERIPGAGNSMDGPLNAAAKGKEARLQGSDPVTDFLSTQDLQIVAHHPHPHRWDRIDWEAQWALWDDGSTVLTGVAVRL